jgi:hypothetical protein
VRNTAGEDATSEAAAAGEVAAGEAAAGEAASYTAAEVDAAVQALGEPGRLAHAQEVVTHAAPALQRILTQALQDGGWFAGAHAAEIRRVADEPDLQERSRAVDVLVAEQTRLGMFVGVAVGFQLAHELQSRREDVHSPIQEP